MSEPVAWMVDARHGGTYLYHRREDAEWRARKEDGTVVPLYREAQAAELASALSRIRRLVSQALEEPETARQALLCVEVEARTFGSNK